MKPTTATQIKTFIERYSSEIARAFAACRRNMRALVPRGYELVYDNYNALGIGYGPGQKATDVIVSIVAYPRWITLFFLYGANLKDPSSLLEGKGSRVRSIRLKSANDLDRADIKQLISQALSPHSERFATCPRLETVIKAISQKQRPRNSIELKAKSKATRRK